MGEFTETMEHCGQGTALYRIQHHRHRDSLLYGQDPGVVYPAYAAIAQWCLGFPDRARNKSRESLNLAKALDQPFSLAFALGMSSFVHHLCREEDIVLKRASSTLKLSTEKGFAQWIVPGIILRGWALTHQGQEDAEITAMQQAFDGWRATGATLVSPYFLLMLADVYAVTGQTEAGLASLAEALILIQNHGERWIEAEVYRMQGELLLKQGKSEIDVEKCFRQAFDVAVRQQAKSLALRTMMSLTRLRRSQERETEVLPLLMETYSWFNEGFDTPDLMEARDLLEEIS